MTIIKDDCKHGVPQFLCAQGCNGREKAVADPAAAAVARMSTSPPRRMRPERVAHTAALPSIPKMAELLGGEVSGGQVLCPGPGHGPDDRSLSVKLDPADREGFVTHSFASDHWKDCRDHVRAMVGLEYPASERKTRRAAWTILAEHIYYAANGERYLKVRKCRDSAGKKQFPQYRWANGSWVKGKPAGPKIPYRLPELIASPTAVAIYFVEGEKDADNLAKIGLLATTTSEGAAAKWDPALTPHFEDRHVVILPDADPPGRAHAQKVAQAIHGAAASVRIVDLYPERQELRIRRQSLRRHFGAHGVHARQRVSDNGHLPLAVAHALVLIYRPSGAGTSANAIRGSVLTPDIWT